MGYQVVIPAAGSGKRLGAGKNKLLIDLLGRPLIAHTLQVFENDGECEGIILVIKKAEESQFKAIAKQYGFSKIKGFIAGGNERQDSVRHGLMQLHGDGVVLIHDGARPFVSHELIHRLVRSAEQAGSAILAVPLKDTVKKVIGDQIQETINRDYLWAAQTPQAFRLPVILEAHQKAHQLDYMATDDAALVEWMGQKVNVVYGDYRNFKITTPEDLSLAEYYILNNKGD